MNYPVGIKILLENASSFAERSEIQALTESETLDVENSLMQQMYQATAEVAKETDFGAIEDSRGVIEKFKGFDTLIASLDTLESTAIKLNNKDIQDTVLILKKALTNVSLNSKYFKAGFNTNCNPIMTMYNSTVASVLSCTSNIIANRISYVTAGTSTNITIVSPLDGKTYMRMTEVIRNLEGFNKQCADGTMVKAFNALLADNRKNFMGASDFKALKTGMKISLGITGVIAFIPTLRFLVYNFYYGRMKIADFLDQQAEFLRINKVMTEGTGISPEKKKQIEMNQLKNIKRLEKLSDKIRVNYALGNNKMGKVMQEEDRSKFNLHAVQDAIPSNTDTNGFQLF